MLAANDLKDAPKMLLTPKAISSYREREGEGGRKGGREREVSSLFSAKIVPSSTLFCSISIQL